MNVSGVTVEGDKNDVYEEGILLFGKCRQKLQQFNNSLSPCKLALLLHMRSIEPHSVIMSYLSSNPAPASPKTCHPPCSHVQSHSPIQSCFSSRARTLDIASVYLSPDHQQPYSSPPRQRSGPTHPRSRMPPHPRFETPFPPPSWPWRSPYL